MIEAMVMHADRKNNKTEGMGRRRFRQMPRIGECIEFETTGLERNHAVLYRVIAVHHQGEAPASSAGDIFVEFVGETSAVFESYHAPRST